VAASEWYARHFGLARRSVQKEARFREGVQYAPSVSLVMDNVNILIYPIQYSRRVYPDHWKQGPTRIASTKGRVVDHVAFSVDHLAATVQRLRAAGVQITDAFLEGPDAIRIELVEGHP
jgi:4-hydroxyphenylpyruvate dioxygenase-like putative hemolysin